MKHFGILAERSCPKMEKQLKLFMTIFWYRYVFVSLFRYKVPVADLTLSIFAF
jgi:hypothetical protein